jgi:hypothetical protein
MGIFQSHYVIFAKRTLTSSPMYVIATPTHHFADSFQGLPKANVDLANPKIQNHESAVAHHLLPPATHEERSGRLPMKIRPSKKKYPRHSSRCSYLSRPPARQDHPIHCYTDAPAIIVIGNTSPASGSSALCVKTMICVQVATTAIFTTSLIPSCK